MILDRMGTRALALGMMAIGLAACHSLRPIEASQLTSSNIDRIWVTRADLSKFELYAPRVTGDTLAGFLEGGQYREMMLSETSQLEARRSDPTRTTVLGVVTGATLLAGMLYMANRNYVGDGATCYTARDGTPVPCCAGKTTISC